MHLDQKKIRISKTWNRFLEFKQQKRLIMSPFIPTWRVPRYPQLKLVFNV